METLSSKQKENRDYWLKIYAHNGIEIGKTIEIWKHPSWYTPSGQLDPEKDSKNAEHYIKYQDQFGVFHSAILHEKHFIKIIEMNVSPSNDGVDIEIWGEADGMFFKAGGHNGEWFQFSSRDRGERYHSIFCTAKNAYNTYILILDKNGNKPIPESPIVICDKHNFAYRNNDECDFCKNPKWENDHNKPKYNPAVVSVLNEGIYTLPQK